MNKLRDYDSKFRMILATKMFNLKHHALKIKIIVWLNDSLYFALLTKVGPANIKGKINIFFNQFLQLDVTDTKNH